MPRPDPYTPKRRVLLQVLMWTVFAATLAMAGIIVHQQNRARHVELAKQPILTSGMSIAIPNKWTRRPNSSPGVVVEAAEPSRGGRTITIYRDALDLPLSPIEYLAVKFALDFSDDQSDEDEDIGISRGTRFGNYPGLLKGVQSVLRVHLEQSLQKSVYAAAILPSGDAVAIKLEGPGEINHNDLAVVDQLARSMVITEQPTLANEPQPMVLENGTRFTPPPIFRLIQDRDPSVTHRRFWRVAGKEADALAGEWSSLEVIPALLSISAKDQAKPEAEFLTMLLTRDSAWRGANIQRRAPGEWLVDLPHPTPGMIFPTRAYLRADEAGHALLAIVRGPSDEIDNYWNDLRQSLNFPPSSDIQQLARAGAAEVTRLRELPLDDLLKDRNDQWHLWVNQTNDPHIGWSHIKWKPNLLVADVEHHLRQCDRRRQTNLVETWSASPDWNVFHSDVGVTDTVGDSTHAVQQQFDLHGDTMSFVATGTNKTLAHWSRSAPDNYVPGAVLVHLIGKLSPTDMILMTDSFLTSSPVAPPGLLTLLVRSSDPQQTGATTRPARSVTIEIVGSGERSRWTFDPDGTLRTVDFPRGIQRLTSNERNIKLVFPDDKAIVQ